MLDFWSVAFYCYFDVTLHYAITKLNSLIDLRFTICTVAMADVFFQLHFLFALSVHTVYVYLYIYKRMKKEKSIIILCQFLWPEMFCSSKSKGGLVFGWLVSVTVRRGNTINMDINLRMEELWDTKNDDIFDNYHFLYVLPYRTWSLAIFLNIKRRF